MTELLEGLYAVAGWDDLTDDQQNVLFVVFQDHASAYEGARLALMVKVTADPDNLYQVHVHYQTEWFHYSIDTKTGHSIWY